MTILQKRSINVPWKISGQRCATANDPEKKLTRFYRVQMVLESQRDDLDLSQSFDTKRYR